MKKFSLVLSMVLFTIGFAMAQRTVVGQITDQNGEALIGATILAQGTDSGTVTDIDGKYSVNVPNGANALEVSYTGYETQVIELGASNVVNISLSQGVLLQDVVVTALGISREKKSLGYAVTELDGEDLSNSRETNIINSLSGKAAGLQIQGSPSTLGGSSRITIRGANSFLGDNQPLFVIDGVPINNSNFATNSQMRGFGGETDPYDYGNMAQDIDPESIETMSILKGASATALYGSRGANGVILITTKSGAGSNGIGIDFNSSASWETVANLIPHQQQYGGGASNPNTTHGFNEVNIDGTTFLYPSYSKDGSWGPRYENQMVRHWDSWDPQAANFGETRPWAAPGADYTNFFETGQTLQNSVALSGGDDKGSVRIGYTNTNQKGTFPNAELKRNALTINSNYQLHERLKVGLAGNYIRTDAENRNITGYNNGNPMQAFTQWWQTQLDLDRLKNSTNYVDGTQYTWNAQGPQKDDDNNLLFFDNSPTFFDNPHWVRENYLQEDTRNRMFGNFNASLNLMKGLDIIGRVGTDFYQFSTIEGVPIASVETAQYAEVERRFQETNMELRLAYSENFGNLSFNGSVGGNRMKQLERRTELETVGGLSLDGFYNIKNSAASAFIETEEFNKGINSVFATASFGFNNWLYLDLTGRNDWSSTLDPNNNSYFYPSASLSAVLTDLPGMGNTGALSFAKVRASWAQAGNDTDPYRTANVFNPQVPNQGNFPRYGVPNASNNPLLVNELTTEYEVGVDLRFLKNRIGLDVAYYNRSTTDQIFEVPSSAATGVTSRILNAGEMQNSGVEMMLNVNPVRTKDFSWDIGINAARQYNKVVSLIEGVESIAEGNTWAASLRISEGFGYMGLFGQDYVRENYEEDADGNIIRNEGQPTVDEDGNYVFTATREFLGSAIPDWIGGFNTRINYQNVSLSALFDFQEGGVIHSTSLQWSKYSGMHPETVSWNGVDDIRQTGLILPGVKADGSANDIAIDPQTYFQSFWNRAAPNVYDASFLKLREIRLDYTIPNKTLGTKYMKDLRIGLYGRNLAILAADLPYLDPQNITGAGNTQGLENAQIPSSRSFGVNIGFRL